jgi:hypothetical protein
VVEGAPVGTVSCALEVHGARFAARNDIRPLGYTLDR